MPVFCSALVCVSPADVFMFASIQQHNKFLCMLLGLENMVNSHMGLAVRAWSTKHVRHSDRDRIPYCRDVMMHCKDADSVCKVQRIPFKILQGINPC